MIQMIFALNYQQPLRQTRSKFFASLEDTIINLIKSCGGNVQQEHKYLAASFDEQTLAFWLDIVILVEKLDQILKDSSDELYGHVCLISSETIDPNACYGMLRELAIQGKYTGIWLSQSISAFLQPYFDFDETSPLPFITKTKFNVIQVKCTKDGYAEDKEVNRAYPLRKTIIEVLDQQKKHPYIVLSGPNFIGLKDALYHFGKKELGDIPPLVFRFGSGGKGLSCIVDAFDPEMKRFFEADSVSAQTAKQLDVLGELVARERLRSEYPSIITEKAQQFLSLLVDVYIKIRKQNADSLIIIENIEEMDNTALTLIIQKVKDLQEKSGISVFCTANRDENLDAWKNLKFKVMFFSLPGGKEAETSTGKNLSRDMRELWEIAYMCFLMRPYFPGHAFLSLFNEEGKNPAVTERAFKMLNALGVITSLQDPEPVMANFAKKNGNGAGRE